MSKQDSAKEPPAILSNGSEDIVVEPLTNLIDAAEQLGVPFSCTEGKCGTCLSKVTKGAENLTPLNETEEIYGVDEGERLLCQAQIKSGRVEIEI